MCRRARAGILEAGRPPGNIGNIGWEYWMEIFGGNIGQNFGWENWAELLGGNIGWKHLVEILGGNVG